jgi:YbgC/YbaW family acyl-CoA thioester hydrolase
MDAKTGRPKNMPDEVIGTFRVENPRVFLSERFPKVAPVEHPFITQRRVERSDLDVYDHVNNAVYIDFAEEAVTQYISSKGWSPAKLKEANLAVSIRRVHIQYSAMAEWGEILTVSTHPLQGQDRGGSHYVGMTRADGSSVADCILDWELVDRVSGEAQILPAELHE